ncbi:MAG: ATP-binding cassette, subfamily bacterial [Frankiaceae bacterium]|nr:ATP-binding cassette, subfamily bacterial [Frankiaceae bacterium]
MRSGKDRELPARAGHGAEPLGWRRLRGRAGAVALVVAICAAVGETVGAVVAGRLAGSPANATALMVGALALALVGSAALDTMARTVASRVIGRGEGRLRGDLLHSALAQPLPVLQEQAVGEIIDRVDDDVTQLGRLMRGTGWEIARSVLRSVLAWIVAGLAWWGAWIAFPVVAALVIVVSWPLAGVVARRKLLEEASWSDHAAQLEEAVAGRDDVRSSLGQPHVIRQYALRAQALLQRVGSTSAASESVMRRSALLLHGMLAALAIGGVALVSHHALTRVELVTVWLLTTTFVGSLNQVAHHLPDVQAGLGALARIGLLLGAQQEPVGGAPLPPGRLDVEFRNLHFSYDEGFALHDVSVHIATGTTCALVGRTGSGKSTLSAFLSRALEPPRGSVFVGGQDVLDTAVEDLRRAVGVVTQRTEILVATLLENVTLFADIAPAEVEAAFEALGLDEWVLSLPEGLHTQLGAAGVTLSAGEEQLVAFARLLVRDVRIVVLDEATARMDPETEQRVTKAAARLLDGRTGIVVAHRLSTTERCDDVAVLDHGRVVQHGPRAELAAVAGPFQELLHAAGPAATQSRGMAALTRTERRREPRTIEPPEPRLRRAVWRLVKAYPRWGFAGALAFTYSALTNVYGPVTGWLWGHVVASLADGGTPWVASTALAVGLLLAPLAVAYAVRIYPLWWVACTLRMRLAILRGQTMQRRLERTPPGEVTARALDSERMVLYVDRWVDVVGSALSVAVVALLGQSLLAGVVCAGVLLLSAAVSAGGAPLAGRSAREAGDQRALFGQSLASALDAVRTIKLAGATANVERHLKKVDAKRVLAHVREHRVRSVLSGVPGVLVQAGVVAAWAAYAAHIWGLSTALLVSTAVSGFGWFGTVAAAAVTEAPVARRWLQAAADLAGSDDITSLPPGVDLVSGDAPPPDTSSRIALECLQLYGVTAVHDDGTVGVEDVDLTIRRGQVILLAGRVGSGKSSLLKSLAGLVDHEGAMTWNGQLVDDPQHFLRPGQVAYVGQVPRVLSGSFHDNVSLDHQREVPGALEAARLQFDVEHAGGAGALVGHRGVRLSGGQVQRLALARALATDAELLVADDVSSALDARTEIELWEGLRRRGVTVVGTSSKRSALARADLVVVLEDGRVVATGTWAELAEDWGHLAA